VPRRRWDGVPDIDLSAVKLGKKPAVRDPRTLKLDNYLAPRKLKPPYTYDVTKSVPNWPMFLNDKLGDCTCAAAAHQVEAWTAAHNAEAVLTDADVLTAYEAVSGYDPATGANDDGAVVLDVLKYWKATGVGGHNIGAFAALAPRSPNTNLALWLFDGVYVGIQLPLATRSMGMTWDLPAGQALTGDWAPGSWGGHAIIALAYNQGKKSRKVITWGQVATVSDRFWTAYVDEVWMILARDWVGPAGIDPEGFNVTELLADLRNIH
jgi:hypothetical protein